MTRILVGGARAPAMLMSLALALGMGSAGAQQVWKCEVAGQVRFSDKPCPGSGQPVAERTLQPNVVESHKPEVIRAAIGGPAADGAASPPPGNACPNDSEMRGMETRGNATSLGNAERRFMQDELRRALQCRAGRGRYTEGDWAISRAAQAAQSQLSDRARETARLRAEAMHSAADPEEGDRISRRRIAEDELAWRQQQAQGAAASAARR